MQKKYFLLYLLCFKNIFHSQENEINIEQPIKEDIFLFNKNDQKFFETYKDKPRALDINKTRNSVVLTVENFEFVVNNKRKIFLPKQRKSFLDLPRLFLIVFCPLFFYLPRGLYSFSAQLWNTIVVEEIFKVNNIFNIKTDNLVFYLLKDNIRQAKFENQPGPVNGQDYFFRTEDFFTIFNSEHRQECEKKILQKRNPKGENETFLEQIETQQLFDNIKKIKSSFYFFCFLSFLIGFFYGFLISVYYLFFSMYLAPSVKSWKIIILKVLPIVYLFYIPLKEKNFSQKQPVSYSKKTRNLINILRKKLLSSFIKQKISAYRKKYLLKKNSIDPDLSEKFCYSIYFFCLLTVFVFLGVFKKSLYKRELQTRSKKSQYAIMIFIDFIAILSCFYFCLRIIYVKKSIDKIILFFDTINKKKKKEDISANIKKYEEQPIKGLERLDTLLSVLQQPEKEKNSLFCECFNLVEKEKILEEYKKANLATLFFERERSVLHFIDHVSKETKKNKKQSITAKKEKDSFKLFLIDLFERKNTSIEEIEGNLSCSGPSKKNKNDFVFINFNLIFLLCNSYPNIKTKDLLNPVVWDHFFHMLKEIFAEIFSEQEIDQSPETKDFYFYLKQIPKDEKKSFLTWLFLNRDRTITLSSILSHFFNTVSSEHINLPNEHFFYSCSQQSLLDMKEYLQPLLSNLLVTSCGMYSLSTSYSLSATYREFKKKCDQPIVENRYQMKYSLQQNFKKQNCIFVIDPQDYDSEFNFDEIASLENQEKFPWFFYKDQKIFIDLFSVLENILDMLI